MGRAQQGAVAAEGEEQVERGGVERWRVETLELLAAGDRPAAGGDARRDPGEDLAEVGVARVGDDPDPQGRPQRTTASASAARARAAIPSAVRP
ncbi:MAG: hypothetical protein R3B35_08040 [Gemmatimonadales bacterium]